MTPTPGIHPRVPATEYLGWAAWSKTSINYYLDNTDAHMLAYWRGHGRPKETADMRLGTAIHAAVLEPEVYAREYAIGPDCARNKAEWKACEKLYPGRIVLTPSEAATVKGVRDALRSDPVAAPYLNAPGESELSVCWDDPETGLACRSRIDRMAECGFALDLKSCQRASETAFKRDAAKYGHDVQAAMALDGLRACGMDVPEAFLFVCVEKTPPYVSGCYWLDPRSIERGREKYKAALARWRAAEDVGEFPGWTPESRVVEIPERRYAQEIQDVTSPYEG